jgi:hypothetical protein
MKREKMGTMAEELKPDKIKVGDTEQEAFNIRNSAQYLGISQTALQNRLDRLEKEHKPIKRYTKGFGRQKYILKRDLDALNEAREE